VILAVVLVVALVGAGVVIRNALQGGGKPKTGAPCQVTATSATYGLDLEQARNATTIAAVGKRLGMPDHAVSVALATAFLESGLHNLAHGDRDSVGLFQQRPSQGWGTPTQLLTPRYAAAAFYQGLAKVPGWQTLAVTDAAQRVQRSALPHGYAQFEPEGRALAIATTGEAAAGLTCRAAIPSTAPIRGLRQAVTQELGAPALGVALAPARGWTVASWLVAHAAEFRIISVGFGGQRWAPSTGTWQPDGSVGAVVDIVRTPAAAANP
jgi:hypothetical protein